MRRKCHNAPDLPLPRVEILGAAVVSITNVPEVVDICELFPSDHILRESNSDGHLKQKIHTTLSRIQLSGPDIRLIYA